MARLIDANALVEFLKERRDKETGAYAKGRNNGINVAISAIKNEEICPTVDAVEVEKYNALVEMYHDLRDNFIDYYCSGVQNVAPYCLNRCEECVDKWGYCKQYSDYCKGFNPAEVILDDAKMDGDGNG